MPLILYAYWLFGVVSSYLTHLESEAIGHLYHNLNGANWNCTLNLTQINSSNHYIKDQCGFVFNLSNETIPMLQTVTEIQLTYDVNVIGTLPSSISAFTNLKSLILIDVAIVGTIPDSVCDLPNLYKFLIEDVNFTGALPNCITDAWPNLSIFYLSGTPQLYLDNINGTLGCEWEYLQQFNLDTVDYNGHLSECISTHYLSWFQLAQLPHLSGTLPSNIIYNTTKLEIFALFVLPSLEGTLDDGLTVLIENNQLLSGLAIEHIHIYAPIPDNICNLNNLKELFWLENESKFSYIIPECFGQNFTEMVFFWIGGQSFNGIIPDSICSMNQLLGFFLVETNIGGTIPSCLSNLTDLVFLQIENNMNLKGEIIEFNSNRTQLIVVTNNSLDHSFSDKFILSSYPALQYVALHENNFIDIDISYLLHKLFLYSPKLQLFSVYNNMYIGGTIPDFDKDIYLDSMRIFAAHNCDIYGSLPNHLHFGRNLTNSMILSAITLYNNRLSSEIPAQMMLQSNVTPVIIYGNLLSITDNKEHLKWMNNSLFINTNLYIDQIEQIKHWIVLIFCICLISMLLLQRFYQCYKRNCFKTET
eukprot:263116_1